MKDIQQEYTEIKSKFNEFLTQAKDYRAVWEIRSYVNESFYEGNHRVVFDRTTKQLITLPIKSDTQYQIGKIRKIVRGVKNMITKNEPRWHIRNSRIEPLTEKERQVATAVLSQKYKEEHIKDKIKDLLVHSLTKTLAWMYVGYDSRKDDIDIFVEDPFNIYTSPDGRLEGPIFVGKYIIRTIRKSVTDIKNSKLYINSKFKDCIEKITPESRMAESDYKDGILSENYKIPVDDNGSAIVKELYILEPVKTKKNQKDNFGNVVSVEEDQLFLKDSKVRIITMVGDLIIRDEITDYDQFPFLCYQAERDKGLLYSPAWIEPLIDLNRSLNDGYSNRADWLDKFAKGRLMIQKGSKFTVMKGKNGQIIEYTGQPPRQMEIGNLPQEVNIHLSETERYMEDIGGIHSESMGRLSGNAVSGVAIAQLQASDNNNVSEPVDNLKTFIEEVAYRILDLASKYYKYQSIEIETKGTYYIIGSNVKREVKDMLGSDFQKEVIEIKPLRNVEVEIIPGSAFSDLQARMDLLELKGLGLPIPDKLIIDSYKLGNTEEIITTYENEQAQKMIDESGMEGLESNQAELENKKMFQGIQIAVQQSENHKIHLAIHGASLKAVMQNQELAMLFQNHMLQHESLLGQSEKLEPIEPMQEKNIGQMQNI